MGYETVWRAFEANEVSHSAAHYLLAIASALKNGTAPHGADIARMLRVSRAAVSLQIRALKDRGLVQVDENHRVRLTRAGADLVARIAGKREVFRTFLQDVLGVGARTAELDACKVEHLLSEETCAALLRLITFLRSDQPEARSCLRSFREVTADCRPGARCDLCKQECLLNTLGGAPTPPSG